MTIKYSVVIPLLNEESNIGDLIRELEPVMHTLKEPWELICVDDGSTDGTRDLLINLLKEKNYLRCLFFKKNYGQSSAFDAGFKAAKGEFVITMDGDRQNDPADIPKLVEMIKECDMVCGQRVDRRDPLSKRVTSKLANCFRNYVCKDGIEDTGCSLKIYRTPSLRKIKMYNGMHRFLPALFKIEGFKVEQVPVHHRQRLKGRSNYNFFNRSLNTLSDLWAVAWMKKRQLRYEIEREIS